VRGTTQSFTSRLLGKGLLPPLAQIALEEAEAVANNLDAELEGKALEAFTFHNKEFVVSVGAARCGRCRGDHHRRAAGPHAQGRHRVGVSPVGQAPARLGPTGSSTLA
jgi:hypothetical protein